MLTDFKDILEQGIDVTGFRISDVIKEIHLLGRNTSNWRISPSHQNEFRYETPILRNMLFYNNLSFNIFSGERFILSPAVQIFFAKPGTRIFQDYKHLE